MNDGGFYEGDVVRGAMTGEGYLCLASGKSYKGIFEDGKLNGEGRFFIEGDLGTYSFESIWSFGAPELKCNQYLLDIISPAKEEEDPKAKKDKKATDEEEFGNNEIKLCIDITNPNEEARVLSLGLTVSFQGEAYPNPAIVEATPEEDAKKKKKGDEELPSMIVPEPVTMEKESGRLFEFELGRMEAVKNTAMEVTEEMKSELNTARSIEKGAASDDKSQHSVAPELVWTTYKLDQKAEGEEKGVRI